MLGINTKKTFCTEFSLEDSKENKFSFLVSRKHPPPPCFGINMQRASLAITS